MEPEAVISRVYEKSQCLYVEGKARTPEGWRKAGFIVYKGDIQGMSPDDFERFMLRKLPQTIEGMTHM